MFNNKKMCRKLWNQNEKIQQKLLSMENLTFETALIKTALSFESAYKDAKVVQASSSSGMAVESDSVHRVGEQTPGRVKRECYCCGSTAHLANACKFRNRECFEMNFARTAISVRDITRVLSSTLPTSQVLKTRVASKIVLLVW